MATITAGALRLWHIPQIPMAAFYVDVASIEEAAKLLVVLAEYDAFQEEHHVKPDYSNASGLCVYEDGEWVDWYDDESEDIWDYIRVRTGTWGIIKGEDILHG